MQAQNFKESNKVFSAPKGMENCYDMHVFQDHEGVTSFWTFSEEELKKIVESGGLFVKTFSGNICYPLLVSATFPGVRYKSRGFRCYYTPAVKSPIFEGMWLWIGWDAPPPNSFRHGNKLYIPDTTVIPCQDLHHKLKPGDYWVGAANGRVEVMQRVGDENGEFYDAITESEFPEHFDRTV